MPKKKKTNRRLTEMKTTIRDFRTEFSQEIGTLKRTQAEGKTELEKQTNKRLNRKLGGKPSK